MATKDATRILSGVKLKAEAGGVDCNTLHTIGGAPWEAIIAAAKKPSAMQSSWRRMAVAASPRCCSAARRKGIDALEAPGARCAIARTRAGRPCVTYPRKQAAETARCNDDSRTVPVRPRSPRQSAHRGGDGAAAVRLWHRRRRPRAVALARAERVGGVHDPAFAGADRAGRRARVCAVARASAQRDRFGTRSPSRANWPSVGTPAVVTERLLFGIGSRSRPRRRRRSRGAVWPHRRNNSISSFRAASCRSSRWHATSGTC